MGDIGRRQQAKSPNRFVPYAERKGMTWPPGAVFSEILPLAKDFDQAAIGMLYRRFLPAVYRYILARVADVATAEDLTSETFLAMIRGITSTRATDELGYAAWLLGIARNQVLMHFRRHKIRPEVELLPQYIDRSQTVAEEDDPMLVLMARETWNETAEALEKLTEEQKTVIIYRCVLGYSTDEVAEMMNKRPGTVRVIQFRALSALTRHLNARPAEASSATKSANEPEAPEKRRQYGG